MLLTDPVGGSGEPTVPVGEAGHHGDEAQARPGTQLLAEEPRRCADQRYWSSTYTNCRARSNAFK